MSILITVLLVILGIALVIVFLNRGKDEQKAKVLILGIFGAAIVLTIVRFFVGGSSEESVYDPETDNAVATITADVIVEASKGRRAVILAELERPTRFQEVQLAAFQEHIQTLGVTILGVESAFPNLVVEEGVFPATSPEVGADALENVLSKYSDVELIISMAGTPNQTVTSLGRKMARVEFYALSSQPSEDWVAALRDGVLDGAIVPVVNDQWNFDASTNLEIFNNQFVFVTRENFNEKRSRFMY